MGALGKCENEELVCADMFEADEDKPKQCNLASMLYDLDLLEMNAWLELVVKVNSMGWYFKK